MGTTVCCNDETDSAAFKVAPSVKRNSQLMSEKDLNITKEIGFPSAVTSRSEWYICPVGGTLAGIWHYTRNTVQALQFSFGELDCADSQSSRIRVAPQTQLTQYSSFSQTANVRKVKFSFTRLFN